MSTETPTLVLVHGWGFDTGFWTPRLEALPEFPSLSVELGSAERSWPAGPLVAVGHSLGFLWLLRKRPFTWRALVAINGFPRFTEGNGFAPAVAARTLERMISQFERQPRKVVDDFIARCGGAPPETLDVEQLRRGLGWLRDWDQRQALENEKAPVLALAGRSDPIVPEAMSAAAFDGVANVSLHWRDGGHLLPRTDPVWCAERIRECLKP